MAQSEIDNMNQKGPPNTSPVVQFQRKQKMIILCLASFVVILLFTLLLFYIMPSDTKSGSMEYQACGLIGASLFCLFLGILLINRWFLQPSEKLVNHIIRQSRGEKSDNGDNLPDNWTPWFNIITSFRQKSDESIIELAESKKALEEKINLIQRFSWVYERNEELTSEVHEKNEKLHEAVEMYKRTSEELRMHRDHLDEMVKERTVDLSKANQRLQHLVVKTTEMAEQAKMVLHNIGNATTPMKVQVELMRQDELEQLTLFLEKCYQLMNENIKKIDWFINESPKGMEIFKYMGELIDSLKGLKKQRDNFIARMNESVSYIAEILAMQQAYTTSENEVRGQIDLNVLIEDALRIQESTLQKRNITIIKDLSENSPKILIYKNKLMQVLMNLIKNSYEAIDNLAGKGEKSVISFKTFSSENFAGMQITDSGCGIEPDSMNNIFELGKSSKGSSGFGLYYCKLFVEENNGTLTLESPGQGRGTTVSIRFRVDAKRDE